MNNDRCLTVQGPLAQQIDLLWRWQSDEWAMLQAGRAGLQAALTRTFDVDGSRVIAQCNPARMISASACVDTAALAARPCFLCDENRPAEQRAVAYRGGWKILCNPAPIFDPHFTVVPARHEPQLLMSCLGVLLDLARDLEGRYTVFYNGPKAGASAPDHAHLQASPAGATPFENELAAELCSDRNQNGHQWIKWLRRQGVRIGVTRPGRRAAVICMSPDSEALQAAVREVLAALGSVQPAKPEPMLNLYTTFTDERWLLWLHPRRAHRPSCYGFRPDQFLISPGAVDLAGLL
ncbi:MAG TPA: DUF4922 domain-containing protein, partial [Phycisphaerae bacterium]|nr:DUF4922 domain-containing protein [Phycisphaerae bacterium]